MGAKNCFQSTFLDAFPSPITICSYLKKYFGGPNFLYFEVKMGSKYCFFLDQNFFLRYEHMVIGEGKASKKVLWKQFLAPTNQFFRWIFKFEKKFFFEILGSKKSQNMIFELRVEKIVLGQKT